MTQQEIILQLLKETGRTGLNSYDADYLHHIKQAPTRVHELKQLGHTIVKRQNPDRSVNWILLSEYSPRVKQQEVAHNVDYSFTKDGRAVPRETPKQMEVML